MPIFGRLIMPSRKWFPGTHRGSPVTSRLASSSAGLTLVGCSGAQSALEPAGRAAEQLADLFWWMAGGAVVIWLSFVGLSVYSIYAARPRRRPGAGRLLIIWGGFVFPTVVLAGLLSYGLALLPPLLAPAPAGSLAIAITGEQWWWRVRYFASNGETVELANEVRLPLGEPVEFHLESRDVIHSFWIPALGGKVDMIPGRRTRLRVEPTRAGACRGTCAEYCGSSHALMSFSVRVLPPNEFARWLSQQRERARPLVERSAQRGEEVFFQSGCGSCHSVRGTSADGVVGPDLTHVGSRMSLAAGLLANEPDAFARWVAHTDELKPGVTMPPFGMLPDHEVRALAAYLEALQ
jgi:cytochrome c oxidase subunit II